MASKSMPLLKNSVKCWSGPPMNVLGLGLIKNLANNTNIGRRMNRIVAYFLFNVATLLCPTRPPSSNWRKSISTPLSQWPLTSHSRVHEIGRLVPPNGDPDTTSTDRRCPAPQTMFEIVMRWDGWVIPGRRGLRAGNTNMTT